MLQEHTHKKDGGESKRVSSRYWQKSQITDHPSHKQQNPMPHKESLSVKHKVLLHKCLGQAANASVSNATEEYDVEKCQGQSHLPKIMNFTKENQLGGVDDPLDPDQDPS